MQSDRQIVPNWWREKKKKKKLMNEFNNQDKPSMRGCRMCDIYLFFFWWLNEWKSKDKWLSFFFVCQGEGEREREKRQKVV